MPMDCRETAEVVAREHGRITGDLGAGPLVRLLRRCDAIRKPGRFAEVLLACECDARGRLGFDEAAYPQRYACLAVLAAVQASLPGAAKAAAKGVTGPQVGDWIHPARVEAITVATPSPTQPQHQKPPKHLPSHERITRHWPTPGRAPV